MRMQRRLIISCIGVVAIVVLSIRQIYTLVITSSLISELSSIYPEHETPQLEKKDNITQHNYRSRHLQSQNNKNNNSYDSTNPFSTLSTSNPITTTTTSTDNIPIRRWGCNITLSPFIFVHIGKAGGGSVRARIAASAVNYTRGELWQKSGLDSHYYPIPNQQNASANSYHKGKFCTSKYPHFRPIEHEAFEGVSVCHATTPIGQMIGCPIRNNKSQKCYCSHKGNRCDLIYVGHNFIGSELHWLPGPYLEDWWNNNTMMRTSSLTRQDQQFHNFANDDTNDSSMEIQKYLMELSTTSRLLTYQMRQHRNRKNVSSCYLPRRGRSNYTTPTTKTFFGKTKGIERVRSIPSGFMPDDEFHTTCLNQYVKKGDQLGRNWYHTTNIYGSKNVNNDEPTVTSEEEDWSSLYASLPVARVTVLRDPFSWLLSKFYWHRLDTYNIRCDDIEFGTIGSVVHRNNQQYKNNNKDRKNMSIEEATSRTTLLQHHDQLSVLKWDSNKWEGWMVRYSIAYMLSLCGEDCVSRLHYGKMSLEAMYKQAKHNLYTSFAVVGILNETNTFYDMVSARMSYIDMKLNPYVQGSAHKSPTNSKESKRCKKQFLTNTTFQLELLRNSPEVQFLYNLYHDAIQVNRFQQEEMKDTCNVIFDDDKNNVKSSYTMGDIGSNPTRIVSSSITGLPKITSKTLKPRKHTIREKDANTDTSAMKDKKAKKKDTKGRQTKQKGKSIMILSRVNKTASLVDGYDEE